MHTAARTPDISYVNVAAIEARRADLLAVEAGETTLEALEERILENYLAGRQHRTQMSRNLRCGAAPTMTHP